MQSLIRPLIRPIPLLSLSTIGTASLLATTSKPPKAAPMSSVSTPLTWPSHPHTPSAATWPYHASDFTRQDQSPDADFYSTPRFVTHIDDAAIASLREYYAAVLPRRGRVMDFCSSWVSHYPGAVEEAAAEGGGLRVTGMGLNARELERNGVLNGGRVCVDLNGNGGDVEAALKEGGVETGDGFDAATCVVSIDYLTSPLEVLRSLLAVTKPGGSVHLVVSNRCFPTKAVARWLRISEQERLVMVGDYLHFAGWKEVEVVELSDGSVDQRHQAPGGLQGLMSFMGMGARDPLWVVRGSKG